MTKEIDLNDIVWKFEKREFIISDSSYSFGSFFNRVQAVSKELQVLGIKKGDVVILYDLSPLQSVFLLFATIALQAIALPLHSGITASALNNIKATSNARYIIAGDKGPDGRINSREIFKMEQVNDVEKDNIVWNYHLPAVIIMTSGSSGYPKMALHSLETLLYSARVVNTYFNLQSHDSWLLSLPLYHVSGLSVVFRCLTGKASVLIAPRNISLQDTLVKYQPTHISLVPVQMLRLLDNPAAIEHLQKCKAVFLGGSSISQSLLRQCLEKKLKIYTSYGLTEMASTVAIKKITGLTTDKARILPSYRVKISDENEILLKGQALFLGYYENREINPGLNDDGWFETGDLGSVEKDFITIYGRKDNMFISGGENIYPEEIEKHLMMIDGIEKAVVVAVEDETYGFRPQAFVKMKVKRKDTEIVKYLKHFLPSYKIPDRFLPWPDDYNEDGIKLKRPYFKNLI